MSSRTSLVVALCLLAAGCGGPVPGAGQTLPADSNRASDSTLRPGFYRGENTCTVRNLGGDEMLTESLSVSVTISDSGVPLAGLGELTPGLPVRIGTFDALVMAVLEVDGVLKVDYLAASDDLSGQISETYEQIDSNAIELQRIGIFDVLGRTETVSLECSAVLTR